MAAIQIEPVSPRELRPVLRMTLAMGLESEVDLEQQVNGFIQYAQEMNLDLTRHWCCRENDRIVAACTCLETPGRTVVIFLPGGSTVAATMDTRVELLRHAVAIERDRGFRLANCMIGTQDRANAEALTRADFRRIAELWYMERPIAGPNAAPCRDAAALPQLSWRAYSAADHGTFARLIEATYERTRDCPGLAGLRDIEDVITGHRATGRFDPANWQLLSAGGEPAACILLSENPLARVLEVSYMGVHPRWRGRGLGRLLLERALEIAHHGQYEKLMLAVDSENAPALAIYRAFGFERTGQRLAMVRRLDPTSDGMG